MRKESRVTPRLSVLESLTGDTVLKQTSVFDLWGSSVLLEMEWSNTRLPSIATESSLGYDSSITILVSLENSDAPLLYHKILIHIFT